MPGRPGLTSAEAASRLQADGPNELPAAGGHRLFDGLLHVVAEPMFVLLSVAVALYVLLGELREALILASPLLAVVVITVSQERRAERALDALRDLSSPRAAVLRDGEMLRIAGRDVVQGDIVLLGEGDRVPADGVLRESIDLEVDESLLTGESLSVPKRAAPASVDVAQATALADSHVHSGTLVVRGHGTAEITATGARTELGRIGHALATLKPQQTLLYRETRHMVLWLALLGGGLCVAVVLLYAASRGGWVESALAMSLATGAATAADGKAVWDKSCAGCHAAMAPKTGDKAAWAPLVKRGADDLTASVMKGTKMMPPKGGAKTEEDVRAAVDYIIS